MKTAIELVEAFRRKVRLPFGDRSAPAVTRPDLHLRLLREEVDELEQAGTDLVGAADALADVIFLAIGAAIEWGIPIEQVFAEVSRSNLTKEPGNVRSDGKVLKTEAYRPPDIAAVLDRALYEASYGPKRCSSDKCTDPNGGT